MKLLAIVVTGAAFAASAPSRGVDPSAALKNRLRNLVVAQEAYWTDHGTYTTDLTALGVFTPHRVPTTPADSVWLEVIQAGGRSWWANAVRFGHPHKSCVIYVGEMGDFAAPPTTDGGKLKASAEGQPTCDTF